MAFWTAASEPESIDALVLEAPGLIGPQGGYPPIGTPEELQAAHAKLDVVQPCDDMRIFYGPDEKDWVEGLIQQAWPSVTFGEGKLGSTSYQGAIGTVTLTNRYFRAVAKIGFHYFLTQFPAFDGSAPCFSEIDASFH